MIGIVTVLEGLLPSLPPAVILQQLVRRATTTAPCHHVCIAHVHTRHSGMRTQVVHAAMLLHRWAQRNCRMAAVRGPQSCCSCCWRRMSTATRPRSCAIVSPACYCRWVHFT